MLLCIGSRNRNGIVNLEQDAGDAAAKAGGEKFAPNYPACASLPRPPTRP